MCPLNSNLPRIVCKTTLPACMCRKACPKGTSVTRSGIPNRGLAGRHLAPALYATRPNRLARCCWHCVATIAGGKAPWARKGSDDSSDFCMTAAGIEPTPLRTGALSQRLRPLGQTVLRDAGANKVPPLPTTKFLRRQKQSMALTKF